MNNIPSLYNVVIHDRNTVIGLSVTLVLTLIICAAPLCSGDTCPPLYNRNTVIGVSAVSLISTLVILNKDAMLIGVKNIINNRNAVIGISATCVLTLFCCIIYQMFVKSKRTATILSTNQINFATNSLLFSQESTPENESESAPEIIQENTLESEVMKTVSEEKITKEIIPLFGPWSKFAPCDKSCGAGSETEIRSLISGEASESLLTNTRNCNKQECPSQSGVSETENKPEVTAMFLTESIPKLEQLSSPIENPTPEWGNWSSFGVCSKGCGGGTQSESRQCISGECVGPENSERSCNTENCPINGGWSAFSPRNCSSCYSDVPAVESRTCTNPSPQFGGQDCIGEEIVSYSCPVTSCDITKDSLSGGTYILQRDNGSCLYTFDNNIVGAKKCPTDNSFYAVQIYQSENDLSSVTIANVNLNSWFMANPVTMKLDLTSTKSRATDWKIYRTSDNYSIIKMANESYFLPSISDPQTTISTSPCKMKLVKIA